MRGSAVVLLFFYRFRSMAVGFNYAIAKVDNFLGDTGCGEGVVRRWRWCGGDSRGRWGEIGGGVGKG